MKIAIVGGGTSGWMSAAYLLKNNPDYELILIDKEIAGSVGVGEATILDFKPFMTDCGFDFFDLLLYTGGSFKSGIMFNDWKQKGRSIWHPFFQNVHFKNSNLSQWDFCLTRPDLDFKKYGLPMLEISESNQVDIQELNNYAYHIDCGKLVKYIENKIFNFITVVRSSVKEVVKKDTLIEKLILENDQEISADLYMDCTGWKNLLKEPKKVESHDYPNLSKLEGFDDNFSVNEIILRDSADDATTQAILYNYLKAKWDIVE